MKAGGKKFSLQIDQKGGDAAGKKMCSALEQPFEYQVFT